MIASAGWHKAEQYGKAICARRKVACEAIYALTCRQKKDLCRVGKKGFPYHFDVDKASSAIDFFSIALRHSIGDYAGMSFELEPWQAYGVGLLFGWRRDDDGTRRFRNLYWSMGRKNGKTTLAAGLSHLLAGFDVNPNTQTPEQIAEVILAATKKEQVEKVMFAEAQRMREQSELIRESSKCINRQITYAHNGGSIRCVGSDRPYDGLNPHAVLLDEVHAWRKVHRDFFNTMTTGSGSRSQPLNAIFTTAGDDRSYLWLDQYRYAKRVALGEIKDETLLPIIYECDEDDDPLLARNWIKSNPNLGVSIKRDYLKSQAKRARTSERGRNVFTRYHGNRLVSANARAFDVAEWDACTGELSDWSDADGIGVGIDLGGRDDLASFAMCARFPIDEIDESDDGTAETAYRYELLAWSFIAESTERDLTAEPFASFVYQDRLKVCRYPIADLKAELLDQCYAHRVTSIAYDPAGGQDLAEQVEREGFVIASMGQTYRHFNEPIAELMDVIKSGRLTHSGCPLLSWAAGNAVTVNDRQNRVMFDKSNSSEKIDPIVASVMAFRRAMLAPKRPTGSFFLT